ncbi:MAG: sigma-70 family RNA polymerase sigma factor [Planctomycetales bacterium]|nr:sigma-70 family RNA polymerase sigma factor [Planctomycetales bacterium]
MTEANVERLIVAARTGSCETLGQLLQLYRNYLTILASSQLGARLRTRVSPSDIVQETMLAAHRDFQQFRGSGEREFLGWLRQVLINTMHHAVEMHVKAQRRDIRREISLEQIGRRFDQSATNFVHALADPGPSPSAYARRRETAVDLADQLAKLRPHYRDVIVLRNLQGLSFEEIGERMGRTAGAVRMLWLRAMEKFKQVYQADE